MLVDAEGPWRLFEEEVQVDTIRLFNYLVFDCVSRCLDSVNHHDVVQSLGHQFRKVTVFRQIFESSAYRNDNSHLCAPPVL